MIYEHPSIYTYLQVPLIFMNYCVLGFGHAAHMPPSAMDPLGHGVQNLRFSDGMKPSGQLRQTSSKSIISFGSQCEQEFLSPFGI